MDSLPPNAQEHLPVLVQEVEQHWPGMPVNYLAAQVEQETCVTLKSRKCWSPHAELKTSREYGFGLGQITITSRFNNFKEAKKLHPTLQSWKWEDRYNPKYQLRTMVLMDKAAYSRLDMVPTFDARFAMTLSSYNGGLGGLLKDRRLCAGVGGCDPDQWWGHVEETSYKAKTKAGGYGKSFFEINREYVRNIMRVRCEKYAFLMLGYWPGYVYSYLMSRMQEKPIPEAPEGVSEAEAPPPGAMECYLTGQAPPAHSSSGPAS